jgi:hypothetical protein
MPVFTEGSPEAYVHGYLVEVAPAVSRMFHVLLELVSGDRQNFQRIKDLEHELTFWSILAYGNIEGIDEKEREKHRIEAAERSKQLAEIDLELDKLRSGEEGKTLAVNSIAAGIIFIARHGIEIGERHGASVSGRDVVPGYALKEFIIQARHHAAHYSEIKEIRGSRDKFQKEVLKYDQRVENTTDNRSFQLLEILEWRSWNHVWRDVLSLFRLT